MRLATTAVADWNDIKVVPQFIPQLNQQDRIIEALGSVNRILRVHKETLSRYYKYLKEHLCLPFLARFPKPATFQEEDEFRCTVLEILDPAKHLGDGFDGIFCNIHKGIYEINLPLIDLYLPEDSPNSQFIEDYWYWFCNCR